MKFKETQIIALANQKGGCGKTTSSVSIAAAFNKLGYSVALVDTDPQCNATQSFGIDPHVLYDEKMLSLLDAFLNKRAAKDIQIGFPKERFDDRLFVVPGNEQLGEVGIYLELEAIQYSRFKKAEIDLDKIKDEHRNRLKESLKSLRGQVDVVIIDTPPNLGFLMTSALVAADWFIIPVFPSKYDLNGLESLTQTINQIRVTYNPELQMAGVLLGNFDKTTKLDTQIYSLLCKKFGETSVFQTTIGRGVRMKEMVFNNQTIFEFEDTATQANDFLKLVKEMIGRAMKGKNTTRPLPKIEEVIEHASSSGVSLDVTAAELMGEVSNG
jgi:chromosome partitioning protein